MKTDIPASPPRPSSFRPGPLRWLFLVIFLAALWVPFFNRATPRLFGFPFFYWYQLLCVPAASLLTFIILWAERGDADQ